MPKIIVTTNAGEVVREIQLDPPRSNIWGYEFITNNTGVVTSLVQALGQAYELEPA